MIKTIVYTPDCDDTVLRGTQCQTTSKSLISSAVATCLCLVRFLRQMLSRRISTSPKSDLMAHGTTPFGTMTQMVLCAPSGALQTSVFGSRWRRQAILATCVPMRFRRAGMVRSHGTAPQTPRKLTSAISSTQSVCFLSRRVRGSSPGSRISSTFSSVVERRLLKPKVGVFDSLRCFQAGEAQTEEGYNPLAGAADYPSEGRVAQTPPPASSADSLGPSGRERALTSVRGRVVRTPLRVFVANPCHQRSDGMDLQHGSERPNHRPKGGVQRKGRSLCETGQGRRYNRSTKGISSAVQRGQWKA